MHNSTWPIESWAAPRLRKLLMKRAVQEMLTMRKKEVMIDLY